MNEAFFHVAHGEGNTDMTGFLTVDENRVQLLVQLAGRLQHFVRSAAAAAASHHLSTLVALSERLK